MHLCNLYRHPSVFYTPVALLTTAPYFLACLCIVIVSDILLKKLIYITLF